MTALATLSERQRWHREQLARASMVRGFVGELVVMSAAMFANWVESGALRPHGIDGRERLAKRPPRGAWELLQWVAAVCARQRLHPDGGRRNFNALQVPWMLLAHACGCSPDQLARRALPWLVERDLLHREYFYDYVTKRRKGYRRDGSTGSSNQRPCVLMLGIAGEALVKHRKAAAAASRARAALTRAQAKAQIAADRKKADPRTSLLSYERSDPLSTATPMQSARARVGEETPPTAAPSVVQVEALRRRFPMELRQHRRPLTLKLTTPTPVEMSTATAVDEKPVRSQRLVTKGASAGSAAGDELRTQCQRAPVAPEAAQAPPDVSAPAPASDATATAPGAPGEEQAFVRGLLADFFAKAGGDRAPPPPAPPPPTRGSQGALPGKGLGVLLRTTQRRADQRGDEPAASPAPAAVAVLGPPRSAAEREENERRRREALERARRESGDDDGGAA